MTTRFGGFGVSGVGSALSSVEKEIFWGGDDSRNAAVFASATVSGAARDSGNSPTTELRPGLLMGKISASGKYAQYDPTATDGTQIALGVLTEALRMTDYDANNADRQYRMCVGGNVRTSELINLDDRARAQMGPHFRFDDDLVGRSGRGTPYTDEALASATQTLVAADNGKRIIYNNAATGTITLPAVTTYGFKIWVLNGVDQDLTIASAEGDNLIGVGDLSADSVTLSTASEKLGVQLVVEQVMIGSTPKWFAYQETTGDAITVTVAT